MNKKICFDLDGTLCTNTWGKYTEAKPIAAAINKVNELYDQGFEITIFTSRYMGKNKENIKKAHEEGYKITKAQIEKWGIKYSKLILGKPTYDLLIDDKSLNFNSRWIEINFRDFIM